MDILPLITFLCLLAGVHSKPPNIVFIIADDLGYNDLGFMNPDVLTPTIDKLASQGVKMTQSYVQPMCSPSRSAWMSGYQPYHTGLQHTVILEEAPAGLPTNLTTLPQKLKSLGYMTHAVGKWHLGYCKWEYTPTYRGFDSFLGYYNGMEKYFTHTRKFEKSSDGLDFRFNKDPLKTKNGTYSAMVFAERASDIIRQHDKTKPLFLYLPFQSVHGPLEVPQRFIDKYPNIKNTQRRIYSGMVSALDEAVKNVTETLQEEGVMNDTIIIFTTDNGGWPPAAGNNWPLRGAKTTLWEGGTRGLAFIKGPMVKQNVKYPGLFHAADWFPTILAAAGGKADPGIDGINQWANLINATGPYPRTELVYNVDRLFQNGAYRFGHHKLLVGKPGNLNDWYPVPKTKQDTRFPAGTSEATANDRLLEDVQRNTKGGKTPTLQLYNLNDDPNEHNDLSAKMPDIVKEMYAKYLRYKATEVAPNFPPVVQRADPKYFGGVWSPGWC